MIQSIIQVFSAFLASALMRLVHLNKSFPASPIAGALLTSEFLWMYVPIPSVYAI